MGETSQASVPQPAVGELGRKAWALAQGAIAGFLSIWALLSLYGASDNVFWRWGVILGWPIGLWIIIALHELGHAVVAWAVGWKVVAVAAGPFGFHLANKDFAFVPRSKRTEFEGFVLPVPGSPDVWTIPRKTVISFGGPAANLLFAAGLFAGWWITGVTATEDQFDVGLVAFGGGLASLCIGLGSLMPGYGIRSGTDGDHIRYFWQLTQCDWHRFRAVLYVGSLLRHQLRLRDLPLWILDEVSEVASREGGAFQKGYESTLIGIVLDSPPVDVAGARLMLDEFRQRHGPSEWLNSCDAYFSAVWENDDAKARTFLWRGDSDPEMKGLALAAEAAVLAREGNVDACKALLEQMHSANRDRSVFPDHTFRDIGRQIEAILPS